MTLSFEFRSLCDFKSYTWLNLILCLTILLTDRKETNVLKFICNFYKTISVSQNNEKFQKQNDRKVKSAHAIFKVLVNVKRNKKKN